ncbi:DUF3068 domain-containing protein [Williamsia sp. CHRR-6]|uniref:DUF3068 domain-containing protein n=1 Tax=Williamsia sp. CHRR-6 TaxID=2835871 RepID=UPI001BD9B2C5|nr:DUF3068 domain-containing protein [Williamsia sp. CHRR-6]MBT0567477.1 DUF3068 domain-containing protein [Williamsia sp. CHRR-6]
MASMIAGHDDETGSNDATAATPPRDTRWSAATGRRVGLGAVFAATFLMSTAVLLPTVTVPTLKKLPSDLDRSANLEATDAQVLDIPRLIRGDLRPDTGVPLRLDARVTTAEPTDDRTVTFVATQRMIRTDRIGGERVVNGFVDWVTLDRRSTKPVTGGVARTQYTDDPPVDLPRSGYQYTFPFDTGKRDYDYYDPGAQVSTPAVYLDDRRTIGGLRVYHFRQVIPVRDVSSPQRAGSRLKIPVVIAGRTRDVDMNLSYGVSREIWVEPRTGIMMDRTENIDVRYVGGGVSVQLIKARLHYTEKQARDLRSTAQEATLQLELGRRWIPIGLGALGLACLIGGGVVLRRPR